MRRLVRHVLSWIDNDKVPSQPDAPLKVDWPRMIPFISVHLVCFAAIWVGVSWVAVITALVLYAVRMFAITGIYHRYFSHRSYSTSRVTQFIFAVLGNSSAQRGPLWWAAHHRHHHRTSDMPEDRHSPRQSGFLWSHVGWISARANFHTELKLIPDFAKYPELRLLDRFDVVVPTILGFACYFFGKALEIYYPELGTTGWQMLIWGFFISTVAVAHATFTVNSLTHLWGRPRYDAGDDSRNSLLIALITFGEGWHNNHHHYQTSVRQGHRWWEIDITFYVLWLMSCVGLIWNLKPVPAKLKGGKQAQQHNASQPTPSV